MSLQITPSDPREICLALNSRTPVGGLFEGDRDNLHPDSNLPWRISPEPFWLSQEQHEQLQVLGKVLHQFYKAANLLYHQSVKGLQPTWVHQYLDQGKPGDVLEMGLWNRVKSHLPLVMRPDLLLTDDGFRIMEMDSIPGGMGFTAQISALYADLGYDLIGGADGLVNGFYEAIAASTKQDTPTVGLVVSDESESYRDEMQWLADQLRSGGHPTYCTHPRDLHFTENGLFIDVDGQERHLDAVYRFFELFDLKNIPKAELITYFAKKNAVRLTPPPKAYLEEKMWLALFHHPLLAEFWQRELPKDARAMLTQLIPRTWIADARPLPPHAVIPGLEFNGRAVNDWQMLKFLSKKQRELVLKPSGFSELAYESKGVSIGHDMPEETWAENVQTALDSFNHTPYILQEFHKAARKSVRYYDFSDDEIKPMRGRVLLRPYYYVIGEEPQLSGMQAVICPPDKKVLHGMIDAVIAPCAVSTTAAEDAF
ncbi:MAG: hypothetical protein ACKVJG_09035 [Candidatus Latescibacterota bacterium]|jgi:hypothetical protein